MTFSFNEALKYCHKSFHPMLKDAIKLYGKNIEEKINQHIEIYESGDQKILPFNLNNKVFAAFNFDINILKVVIIGQDPYIHREQAIGLCFAVPNGIKIPPSLNNIWKEMESDLKITVDKTKTDLSYLMNQGVLLMNAALSTVEEISNKHAELWKPFTDFIINYINKNYENIIYVAWGNFAINKLKNINEDKNLLLKSGHPSPLSVRFFTGCKHFSKTNEYLKEKGKNEIIWN